MHQLYQMYHARRNFYQLRVTHTVNSPWFFHVVLVGAMQLTLGKHNLHTVHSSLQVN